MRWAPEPEMKHRGVERAAAYELHARATPGSFPIALLGDAQPFWSKGWKGCPFGCGQNITHEVRMVMRVSYTDGVIRKGWYCR
jgi:hypothetical protein